MINRRAFFVFLIFVIFLISACTSPQVVVVEQEAGAPALTANSRTTNLSFSGGTADSDAGDFEADGFNVAGGEFAETAVQQERLIIRTGDLSLIVTDTEATMTIIAEMAESSGGWVVTSNVYNYREAKRGSITIRIPADGFNSALEEMKALAVDVENESITGQDVTEEFVDLSLRLANLEATAAQVRTFLEDANEVEETLAVYQELSRLEGEIERIKGRQEFLAQSAQFSTINVSLTPDVLNNIEIAGWRPKGVANEAVEALIEGLQGTGSFLIWLAIYVLPMALLYGVPLFFIVRYGRRWWLNRRARRNSERVATES